MFISIQNAKDIVNEMKKLISRDINIMDERGIILASTNPSRNGTLHEGAARVIREKLPLLVIEEDDNERGMQKGINIPIMPGGRVVGVIGITGVPAEVSLFGNIIKRMTELMIENIWQYDEIDIKDKEREAFVEKLLFEDHADINQLRMHGRRIGMDIDKSYVLALISIAPDIMQYDIVRRRVCDVLQDAKGSFCIRFNAGLLLLIKTSSRAKAHELLVRISSTMETAYGFPLQCGMSSSGASGLDIRKSYAEAVVANTIAAGRQEGAITVYDRKSPEFIVQAIPGDLRRNLHQLLFGSCAEQEAEELEQIIYLYFLHEGELLKMAESLYVHVNTVRYRISRLHRHTGFDLRKPGEAMMLYIAMTGRQ